MKTLFEVANGQDTVKVIQVDAERVEIAITIRGTSKVVTLAADRALHMATAIQFENVGLLMHVAENELDDVTCAAVGQALLFGPAKRTLDRQRHHRPFP